MCRSANGKWPWPDYGHGALGIAEYYGDAGFTFKDSGRKLSSIVSCYNPTPASAYADIKANLAGWVEAAISSRRA